MKKSFIYQRLILQIVKISMLQTLLVFMFTSVAMANPAKGQNMLDSKVSLTLNNISLEKALHEIEKSADVKFSYNSRSLKSSPEVNFIAKNELLSSLLDRLLSPMNVKYVQVSNKIVLRKKGDPKVEFIEYPQIGTKTDNSIVADIIIKGKVIDAENNEPLIGVNVLLKGTTKGASSNSNGEFTIDVPNNQAVLIFSFLGYFNQEIAVSNLSIINVSMKADNRSLNEVVVIGYGTQSKKDLTGSVAIIDQKVIKDMPASSIDQKMVGQVAGVQIQQLSGAPGTGTSIKIRGTGSLGAGNEPLYVVDGMPYSSTIDRNVNPLALINPDDIESVTILKDASSTAIYGSRGANGVIMITTKKGKGNKTEINYSSMTGFQQVPQKGRPKMLGQRDFAELQRDKINLIVRRNENRDATVADYPLEYQNLDLLVGKGTDWYDMLFQEGIIRDNNLSILKGSKDSRINFSLGYFDQEGVMKNSGLERFSAKLGFESKINKAVNVGVSFQPTYMKTIRANTNDSRTDIIGVALWANPISKAYDENGVLKPYIVTPQSKYHNSWSFANPLFVLQETKQEHQSFQNIGSAFAEWAITPDLKARTSLNTIFYVTDFSNFTPSTVGGPNRPPAEKTANSYNAKFNSFNWLNENTLTYDKKINSNHRINALVGFTTQEYRSNATILTAGPYANDQVQTLNAAQAITSWNQDPQDWSMISYLARVNYAFNDRYLLTATVRSDGSSRFGVNKRYASFPSVAGAWRISEEQFLKGNKIISNMKMRVSYGKSGNNNIGNYSHLGNINSAQYVFANQTAAASFVGLSNPDLTWEESEQFDAGLDVGFFQDRMSLIIDVYSRKSNNMLLNNLIPQITGFNSQLLNLGSVQNEGLEISFGATPVKGDFTWNANMNIAFNRNKVLSLNDNSDPIYAGLNDGHPTNVTVVGKPIGNFFGFKFLGLYTAADIANPNIKPGPQVYEGMPKYMDIDGNGIIADRLDYTIIGNPQPDFIYGITNSFSYKTFDLNVVIYGQQGGQVINGLRGTVDNLQGFFNVSSDFVNRWRSPNQPGDGTHYRVPLIAPSWGHRVNSRWVEDASFLRIGNVTLGYSIPSELVSRLKFIKNFRLYLSGQNLATFTKYGGGNPQGQSANGTTSVVLTPGFDMTSYPLSRTFSLGINVSF